jgi:transposase
MPAFDDLSGSLTALNQDSTLMTVIEMSNSSWLVAGMVPGTHEEARSRSGGVAQPGLSLAL